MKLKRVYRFFVRVFRLIWSFFLAIRHFSLYKKFFKFRVLNDTFVKTIKHFEYDYFFILTVKRFYGLVIMFFTRQVIFFCIEFVDFKYKRTLFLIFFILSFIFSFFDYGLLMLSFIFRIFDVIFLVFVLFFILFFFFVFDNLFYLGLFILFVFSNLILFYLIFIWFLFFFFYVCYLEYKFILSRKDKRFIK